MMNKPKKLIEVAMPVKEISTESVRDKSIRHGHISTLHLWWARRPLPVCRAVIFASLVPDPLDENCPQQFRDAVEILLGSAEHPLRDTDFRVDVYKPYSKIPYTAVADKMEDNPRNRLLMFIGKYSDEYCENERRGKKTEAKKQLSDYSLIKWDNKNNVQIIEKARKLIWVAHNCSSNTSVETLLMDFEKHQKAIKTAEEELYQIPDRHIEDHKVISKTGILNNAIDEFLNKMPKVFDPFAGGGAIPLEASRLGCRSYANDINPVAHIIQKGSVEFPQKYGKPIKYSKAEFIKKYGEDEWYKLPNDNLLFENGEAAFAKVQNRLAFDVEYYAKKLLERTEKEIGHLYPPDENGNKPVAYYWARVGICSNPSCRAEVPLLGRFYLCNSSIKKVYLEPIITDKNISFCIKNGATDLEGWMRQSLVCPCCKAVTSIKELKQQSINFGLRLRLLAVIMDSEYGKSYRLPTQKEIELASIDDSLLNPILLPNEEMKQIPDLVSGRGWGILKWSKLFTHRQLLAMQTLVSSLNLIKAEINSQNENYKRAVITFLGIFIDKISSALTSFSRWNIVGEKLETPFSKQALPMIFDFPESNLFSGKTGSALNQLQWIIRYIDSESANLFSSELSNASSGEKNQFPEKSFSAVITDPPYYDAIAYADLSDFFYVWLKRTLADFYTYNFSTPQTPKSEECTALKHHHENSKEKAQKHFENKLLNIFDAIQYQTSDIVSIMFAHQSTEAWTTLCNSILGANMNISGSWAIDTEMTNRSLALAGSALESSVTVACKPIQRIGQGNFKDIKSTIQQTVEKEVAILYSLGFRGADLLTACFGQAVSVFGNYEMVEKADGSKVTVAELLELARESAFNALLKGFEGDDFTKFYIGWLQLYGLAESDFDDAAKFSRVGFRINVSELFNGHILIKNGNKQTIATYENRLNLNKNLGNV